MKTAEYVDDILERVYSVAALQSMSDSMKTVIHTMYEECTNNVILKEALRQCVDIIDSSYEEAMEKVYTGAVIALGVEGGKFLTDFWWKTVKATLNTGFPALDVLLAGYKTGKLASNALFNTDATLEKYCCMLAVLDIENLAVKTSNVLMSKYQNDRTHQNAEAWFDVYFYDIPLTAEKTYESTVDGKMLNEVTYSISDPEGEDVSYDLDTYQTDKEQYEVSMVSGSIIDNNELLLNTKAYSDDRLDIYAYVPKDFSFAGWTSSAGTDIFADASSMRTTLRGPAENVTVTAKLTRTGVAVEQWTAQSDSSTVKLTVSDGLSLSDATILAARYSAEGQMTNVMSGELQSDERTVVFKDCILEKGWVLYFLSSDYAPLSKAEVLQ